jgi:gliding motility-associated-like protein
MKIYFLLIISIITPSFVNSQELSADFTTDSGIIEFCAGDTVEFLNLSTGYTGLKWIFGDGYETYFNNPKHIYSLGGNFKVSLTVFDASGNSDTANLFLIIHDRPTLQISPETTDTLLNFGQSIEFSAQGNYSSLLWTTGSTEASITVTVSGIYSLAAVGEFGCTAGKTIHVTVSPESDTESAEILVLNNILTPNGDSFNDFLFFKEIEKYEFPLELTIYNSLGKLVFSTNNYQNNWNGKLSNGSDLQVGTYFYIVKSKNHKTGTGFVDLVY